MTKGLLSTGSPTGQTTKFAGVDAYVARPSSSSKLAILIATDIFGYSFVNIQLIADSFTKHAGVLTVVPDLFNNDPLPVSILSLPNEEAQKVFFALLDRFLRSKIREAWRPKHFPPESKMPIVHNAIKELREKEGIEKILIVGYCFGGRISALLASSDLVQGAAVAHPAGLKVPEEIETINIPTLWLCAEVDRTFSQEQRKATQEILEKKRVKNHFKDYAGTEHGFAVRGDDNNEAVKNAKISAVEEVIKFVKEL